MSFPRLFVCFMLSLSLAAPAMAQNVTLRFQHFLSPKSANSTFFLQPWADQIAKDSGGRIRIELYPFMQLGGKIANQFDLIRDGTIDGGLILPGLEADRFPETTVLELPFMVSKSSEISSRAAWEFTQRFLLDDFASVKILATHMQGPGVIHKRGRSISALEDFDGLALRGPSPVSDLLLKRLGAVPVDMPISALPDALQSRIVQGGITTWDMAPMLKLDELANSHTEVAGDMALYNRYFLLAMNRTLYEDLPDDLRAILDANSGLAPSAWAGRAHDKGDAVGRERMSVAGNEVFELSQAETDRLKAVGQAVELDWIFQMTSRGIDGARLVNGAKEIMTNTLAEFPKN